MIHGQFTRFEGLSTIVSDALLQFLLPPIALTQFLGLCELELLMSVVVFYVDPFIVHCVIPSMSEKLS